jgi:DNA (cytosine-5)-methyltransferase 1
MTSLSAIDCFAGAGGLAWGLQGAGFHLVAAFDSDRSAVATYRRNIGSHITECEVHAVTGTDLLITAGVRRGEITLVAGGPPCQGFSNQRRGHDVDPRNELIFEFLRLVREIFPKCFLMENVSSMGTRGKTIFAEFIKKAHFAGYRTSWKILNAADFGVPQMRRRMFVIGLREDLPTAFTFPIPTHRPSDYVSVSMAIRNLPSPGSVAPLKIANHEQDNISDLNRVRISHVPQGGGREHIPKELQLPCHAAASVERAGHRNVYGRLHWDRPSGTITTKCNSFTRGRFAHPAENRNITMREAARLQSFPDEFVFEGNKVDVAHQIGNAVPPALAKSLGLSIIAALEERTSTLRAADEEQLAFAV